MARALPSLAAGLAIGLPLGIVLSYLAALPYFLGLFFFVLFGLVIGALLFRFGADRRPMAWSIVGLATAMVVTATWCASLVVEARTFVGDRAEFALSRVPTLPAGIKREQ